MTSSMGTHPHHAVSISHGRQGMRACATVCAGLLLLAGISTSAGQPPLAAGEWHFDAIYKPIDGGMPLPKDEHWNACITNIEALPLSLIDLTDPRLPLQCTTISRGKMQSGGDMILLQCTVAGGDMMGLMITEAYGSNASDSGKTVKMGGVVKFQLLRMPASDPRSGATAEIDTTGHFVGACQ